MAENFLKTPCVKTEEKIAYKNNCCQHSTFKESKHKLQDYFPCHYCKKEVLPALFDSTFYPPRGGGYCPLLETANQSDCLKY